MIKSVKRLGAAVLSAVMMLTAVATPLGDNLPAVRESTSLTASAAEISTDGYYTLKNLYAGKMLNVRGSYSTSNTNVTVYETDGTTGQEFRFIKSGSNYVLEPKCAPSCALNVYGTSASNGSNVNIWTKSGNSTQAWVMEYNSSSAAYVIRCAANKNLVLTATGTSNSSNVALANYSSGNKSQLWSAAKVGGSTPSPSGAITTQSIQAVLDKYNYRNGMYWSPERNDSSLQTTGYMAHTKSCGITYRYNGKQCWGFANFVMHAVTGTNVNPSNGNNGLWVRLTASQVNELRVGDIVRIQYENDDRNGHSGVVLSINGTKCTFVQEFGASAKINIGPLASKKYGTHSTLASMKSKNYLYFVYRYIGSHTHSYGSWYTKTSATCTSGGTEERKCSCGATESRSTSALGHNYGSTYFEADHPHKYAHLCQRCGYKEFTGGNLAIYEKCDICYNENLPSKPCLNISSNGFKESDNVSFTWDPTDKTTHYNLTVEVLSGDEYKTVCRQTYVNSGFQATFGKGQYRAVLDSYNSNMFHQYTSDWRDWVHNSSDYVYFDIECAHEFLEEVVSPTYDNEGYTLHTCTKCGYSFQDDFVPALSHNKVTGLRAKVRYTNSLILAWDENEDAGGYEIEQYRDGDWQCIETIYDNTEVSYKVDDLRADTTYTFRIRPFVCIQDYNSYGEYTRLAAKTRIPNVTGLTSKSISSSTITLSWNKNNKATGYVIEQYKGGKWSGIATTKNNTTLSFTVKGLETDTTYTFRVKAYRTVNGKTEYSEYRRIQKTTAMDNVTGFKVKSTTSNSVTLTWNKTDRTTDYKIEQYKGGKWVDVDYISNEKSPVYTVTGLAPDTTYTFRIMALKITCMPEANNNSDYVRVAGKTRISNAAKFAGTALSNSAIKLVWSKNNMATGYVIEQYKGGKWTAIATTKNNTTLTFTVKGLAKGTTYSFRIKSFRKTGSTTEFSEYTAIKAATLLDGVSDFKVASTTGSWITLEWAKNDKATGYSIEQYKGGKWTVIATTKNNTTLKFTVKELKNDTTYSFRIRAYKTSGGVTAYSDYVRIAGKTRIPNVAKFTGSAVSASAVKLDWSKNDKATAYVIEQYKGGKWTVLATTKNNTTLKFTVKGLAEGTTYSFRIKAFRKTGSTTEFSEYSGLKAATRK